MTLNKTINRNNMGISDNPQKKERGIISHMHKTSPLNPKALQLINKEYCIMAIYALGRDVTKIWYKTPYQEAYEQALVLYDEFRMNHFKDNDQTLDHQLHKFMLNKLIEKRKQSKDETIRQFLPNFNNRRDTQEYELLLKACDKTQKLDREDALYIKRKYGNARKALIDIEKKLYEEAKQARDKRTKTPVQ
jgi:hypothetical protein